MNDNIILPKSVVLELTYKCNHKCLFCSCPWEAKEEGFYKYEKGRELSFVQWKKVLDKLNLMGVENNFKANLVANGGAIVCNNFPVTKIDLGIFGIFFVLLLLTEDALFIFIIKFVRKDRICNFKS